MAILARIKSLNFKQFLKLSGTLIREPLLILPTYTATRESIKICDQKFGRDHHNDNRTNAFRHALWNYLLCVRCMNYLKDPQKAINWSKKITDLHEDLAPNEELARKMDLHNNLVGRRIFEGNYDKQTDFLSLLLDKMEGAVKIKITGDLEKAEDQLVYIERRATKNEG